MSKPVSLHSFEHRMLNLNKFTNFIRPYDFLPEYKIGEVLNFGNDKFKITGRELIGDVAVLGDNKLKTLGFVKEPSKATSFRFCNWWRRTGYAEISYHAYYYTVRRID